jgi:hypothetical protein
MDAGKVPSQESEAGFVEALAGDGRPLLALTGVFLVLSGAFALFLSATGSFLPHDTAYLGFEPKSLCSIGQCRIVHFMFHDRVAFGGVLIAIGTLYLWLQQFPLQRKEEWAWWAFLVSGVTGFASFLAYLGYGYLDTWHGTATLVLLPIYVGGMVLTRRKLLKERIERPRLMRPVEASERIGRFCLLLVGLSMVLAGAVITWVGITNVFVPEDLVYIGLQKKSIAEISDRLIPLIAHDRAGFGGGLASCGLLIVMVVWNSRFSRDLWQALFFSGSIGFGCALGVHFCVGYTIPTHLAPAVAGTILFLAGIWLARPSKNSYKAARHLKRRQEVQTASN